MRSQKRSCTCFESEWCQGFIDSFRISSLRFSFNRIGIVWKYHLEVWANKFNCFYLITVKLKISKKIRKFQKINNMISSTAVSFLYWTVCLFLVMWSNLGAFIKLSMLNFAVLSLAFFSDQVPLLNANVIHEGSLYSRFISLGWSNPQSIQNIQSE